MEDAQGAGEVLQVQEFPDFDLLDEVEDLGEGGYGQVSKSIVRFTSEGQLYEREAAVKYAGKERNSQLALKREVHARKRMGPMRNILPVLAMTIVPGDPRLVSYIVTPVCACSLYDVIARRRQARPDDDHGPVLLPEEYLTLFAALLAAVSHVHVCRLVHLDIKTDNVLLADAEDFSSVQLADFGLTVEYGADTGGAGTPQCMAPELLGHNLPVTSTGHRGLIPARPAQDVYSLSMLMATCVLGRSAEFVSKCRCRSAHEFRQELMACGCTEALACAIDAGLDFSPAQRPSVARLAEVVHDAQPLLAAPQPTPAVPMPPLPEGADAMIAQAHSSAPMGPVITPLRGTVEDYQRATEPFSTDVAPVELQLDDPAWHYLPQAPPPPFPSAPAVGLNMWSPGVPARKPDCALLLESLLPAGLQGCLDDDFIDDVAPNNGAHNMTASMTGGPSEAPVAAQDCTLGSCDGAVSTWVQLDHERRAQESSVHADDVREAGSAGVHEPHASWDKAGSAEASPRGVVQRQLPSIAALQGRHGDPWAVDSMHGTPYAGGSSTATSALLCTPDCGSPWNAGGCPSPVLRTPMHAGTQQHVECQTPEQPALELLSKTACVDVGCNTDLTLPPGAFVNPLARDIDSTLLASVRQEVGEGESGGNGGQRGVAGMRWGRWAVVAGVAGLVGVVAARVLLRKR